MIPHALPGRVLSFPVHHDPGIVLVTGSALHDQRTAYRLREECGDQLRAWFVVADPNPEPWGAGSPGGGPPVLIRVRRHLAAGPGHLVRLARSLPRWIRERGAVRRRPRELARAEERLLAEELSTYQRRSPWSPQRLGHPVGPALDDALHAATPAVVVTTSPNLIPPEVARSWGGPILTVYPGWSPAYRGEAPVEQALFRRDLHAIGATVHLLTGTGELGPILRRSHPCLVPWDTPESCRHRVQALGTELLCEVVQELLQRPDIVAYDPPVGAEAPQLPPLDARLLAMLQADHRQGWLSAALRDARRF